MNKLITNLRNKHIVVFTVCTAFAVVILIPNKFAWLINVVLVIMSFSMSHFFGTGKFEKPDELAKTNLGRATGISYIIAVAMLFVFSFLGSGAGDGDVYEDVVKKPANIFAAAAFITIALRSLLFVIFDISGSKGEEE